MKSFKKLVSRILVFIMLFSLMPETPISHAEEFADLSGAIVFYQQQINWINDQTNDLIGEAAGQVPQAAIDAFNDVVVAAIIVNDDVASTTEQKEQEIQKLILGYETLESSILESDKSLLAGTINIAQEFLDSAVIGTGQGEYPLEAANILQAEIDIANDILSNTYYSEIEVAEAISALNLARTNFEVSIQLVTPAISMQYQFDGVEISPFTSPMQVIEVDYFENLTGEWNWTSEAIAGENNIVVHAEDGNKSYILSDIVTINPGENTINYLSTDLIDLNVVDNIASGNAGKYIDFNTSEQNGVVESKNLTYNILSIPNYEFTGYFTHVADEESNKNYEFFYEGPILDGYTVGFDNVVTAATSINQEFSNNEFYSFIDIINATNSLGQQLINVQSNGVSMAIPYRLFDAENVEVHSGMIFTGWNGELVFENVPEGTYTIEVDLSGVELVEPLISTITITGATGEGGNQEPTPIVDPKFRLELNDNRPGATLDEIDPNEVKIIGRLEEMENGFSTINFDLFLDNSGMNYDRLIVDGITTAEGKTPINFVLTANNHGLGNYQLNFYMPSFDDEYYDRPESDFDKTTYQTAVSVDQYFGAIPVYPGDKNHVILTFTDELNQEYTTEFDYYPLSNNDIIRNVHFDTNRMGLGSTEIKVRTNGFYGNKENASLVLYTITNETETDVATFDNLVEVTPTVMTDNEGNTYNENVLIFQGDSSNNNIATLDNNTMLFGRIEYNESFTDSQNNVVSTVVSSPIIIDGMVNVDTEGPNPHAYFDSFDDVENEIIIKVNTGDMAELSSITEVNAISFTDNFGNPINFNITSVEPIFEPWMEQDQTSFNSFLLHISKSELDSLSLDDGIIINIDGLYDELGNVMDSLYSGDLHFETEVILIVRDESYITYPGYEFWVEKVDATEPYIRPLMTDDNGLINTWLPYGQYRIYKMVKSGEEPFLGKSTDVEFEVPLTGGGMKYDQQLFLTNNNIVGMTSRPEGMEFTEYIAFMADSDAATLDSLMQVLHDPNFDTTYTEEEKEDFWEQERYYRFAKTFIVETDSFGRFELFLPIGSYQLMGRVMGFDVQEPISGRMSVVIPDTTEILDIGLVEFEQPDFMLNILDNESAPVGISFVNIIKTDAFGEDNLYAASNENGQVPLFLESGATIGIAAVEKQGFGSSQTGKLYLLDATANTFTYDGVMTTKNISLPVENVNIYLSYDGSPLEYERYMNLLIEDSNGEQYDISTHTGGITGFFVDGEYLLKEIRIEDSIITLNQSFTVTGSADVPVDMGSFVNVELTLQDDALNPISNANLDIEIDGYWASTKTDSNGRALYMIPSELIIAGTSKLRVNGYGLNNKWYELNEEYTVNTLPFIQQVTVKGPNFYGYINDDEGNVIFHDGWLSIEKVNGTSNWFGAWINDTDGKFELVLDQGEYIVNDAGSGTDNEKSWMEIKYRFSVDENGDVYDKDNNLVAMPLSLTQVQPNLFGTLFDRDGNPFTETYVSLLVKEVQANGTDYSNYTQYPWLYERWIDVDESGIFGINVEDGRYQAIAISTDMRYIEFATPVDILLESDNSIAPPDYTFQGTVKHYDPSNVIAYGGMGIELVGNDYWDYIQLESGGFFGKNYDNGEVVKIHGVHYQLEGEDSFYEFRYNKAYTMGIDETSSILIKPNIMGVIDLGEPLVDVDWMSINLRPVYEEADFDTQEKYEYYLENQWEYDVWAEMSLNSDGNPVFYTLLKEGTYKVQGMHIDGNFIELNKAITIDQLGTDSNVIYSAINDNYIVNISYVPNVTGQIRDESGTPVANAWINLVSLDSDWKEKYNDNEKLFGTRTDSSGNFELSLEDGHYKLEGFHTEGQFVQGEWEAGEWTSVNKRFQISGGSLLDKDGNEILSLEIQPNISGTVLRLENDETQPLNDAWISFRRVHESGEIIWDEGYWARTGYKDNTFSTYMPAGDYIITDFGGENVWFGHEDIENANFTVSEGIPVNLIVQPKLPNFKGTVYSDVEITQPLKWGWVMVKPASDGKNDFANARWIETDKNGQFTTNLDDGDYIISEFGNFNYWKRTQLSFNITNGSISGLLSNENGVIISPPVPSVIGQVYDKNGNLYEGEAWITIKPIDSDEYDWSNAIWAEYKLEEDGYQYTLDLPAGSYKIIEVGGEDFWYKPNINFSVVEGQTQTVDVTAPVPNVSGTVYTSSDTAEPIGQGWIGVMRIDANGDQVALDGDVILETNQIDEYSGIYWQFTKWTEIEDNTFDMFLENGATYRIIAVSGYNVWYQPDTTFTVGIDSQDRVITMPGDNVTITFINVPTSFISTTEAWLDIAKNIEGDEEYYFFDEGIVEQANNTITFNGRLRDGDYEIRYLGTPDGDVEINQTLTVTGSSNQTIDFNSFTETVIVEGDVTVSGSIITESIYFIINDGQGGKIKVKTDDVGGFSIMLDKNVSYQITEMADKDGFAILSTPIDINVLDSNINTGTLNLQK